MISLQQAGNECDQASPGVVTTMSDASSVRSGQEFAVEDTRDQHLWRERCWQPQRALFLPFESALCSKLAAQLPVRQTDEGVWAAGASCAFFRRLFQGATVVRELRQQHGAILIFAP